MDEEFEDTEMTPETDKFKKGLRTLGLVYVIIILIEIAFIVYMVL